MIELVHQLKGAGLRLGVLTNNVREMGRQFIRRVPEL